jgi:hypothetical protein
MKRGHNAVHNRYRKPRSFQVDDLDRISEFRMAGMASGPQRCSIIFRPKRWRFGWKSWPDRQPDGVAISPPSDAAVHR